MRGLRHPEPCGPKTIRGPAAYTTRLYKQLCSNHGMSTSHLMGPPRVTVMDNTWLLMQESTAVEYMHTYKSRRVRLTYENRGYGMASWPPLPYPESGTISDVLFEHFTEEEFLGVMLMLGTPPHTIRLADVSYHSAYRDTPDNCKWLTQLKDFRMDGFVLTNAMKEYHNFEFLRQLENHDG